MRLSFPSAAKKTETLFRLIPPSDTGIDFVNETTEFDTFNILTEEYIYNGVGVGVGDFNNDGLADLFLQAKWTGKSKK